MSSRGFLLQVHDDDSFDQPVEIRPLSPNIIVTRGDYFEGGFDRKSSSMFAHSLSTDVICEFETVWSSEVWSGG